MIDSTIIGGIFFFIIFGIALILGTIHLCNVVVDATTSEVEETSVVETSYIEETSTIVETNNVIETEKVDEVERYITPDLKGEDFMGISSISVTDMETGNTSFITDTEVIERFYRYISSFGYDDLMFSKNVSKSFYGCILTMTDKNYKLSLYLLSDYMIYLEKTAILEDENCSVISKYYISCEEADIVQMDKILGFTK